MPPILFIRYEPVEGQSKEFRFVSGLLTFGRDQGNDVVVPSGSVSRQHAKIVPAGNHWIFCDLGSTNGSWLNDNAMPPHRYKILRSGDEFILADARYVVRLRPDVSHPIGRYARSILILENEKFQREIGFEAEGATFPVGGPDGQLKVPGMISEQVQLDFRHEDSAIVAVPAEGFRLAQLNGEPLIEKKKLADGDVLELSGFMILVNDSPKTLIGDTSPEIPTTGHITLNPNQREEQATSTSPGWGSSSKRDISPPRKFVFGAEESTEGTVVVPALQMAKARGGEQPQTGFDMNISRRMATVPQEPEESEATMRGRRMVFGMLFIAFSLFVGLIVVLLLILK